MKELEGINVNFDPPEKTRTYRFPNNELIELKNVTKLIVRKSGTHRLETNDGKSHIVPTGWIHIELDIKDWTV